MVDLSFARSFLRQFQVRSLVIVTRSSCMSQPSNFGVNYNVRIFKLLPLRPSLNCINIEMSDCDDYVKRQEERSCFYCNELRELSRCYIDRDTTNDWIMHINKFYCT